MKILQLCYKMPYPLHDGGEYSIYHSALSLLCQKDVEVKILAMNTHKNWVDISEMPTDFIANTNFEYIEVDTRVKPAHALKNLWKDASYFVERFYEKAYEEKLISIIKENNFDIVLLEHAYLGIYVDAIRNNCKSAIILRAQNIEYRLWESYCQHVNNPFIKKYLQVQTKRLFEFETDLFSKVDGIIALTDKDKEGIKGFTEKQISVIPVAIDFKKFTPYHNHIPPTKVVYHLGSMDWKPNIQGLKWFVNDILPKLAEKKPDIKVHLAGKKMPKWFYKKQNKNLFIEGQVADSKEYQKDKSILIVPLLSGSGIRVKIMEALALGKTVVSTSVGALGLVGNKKLPVHVADSADEFAASIIKALDNTNDLPDAEKFAMEWAETNFDIQVLGKNKIAFFDEIINRQSVI